GELVGTDHAAGAAYVLDDDGGLAGNVRGQMLSDDAPLDIGRAAGRVVDDHGDGLALVELGTRGVCTDRGGERDHDEQPCSGHRSDLPCEWTHGVISSLPLSVVDHSSRAGTVRTSVCRISRRGIAAGRYCRSPPGRPL